MRGKDELRGTRGAILSLGCTVLSTGVKTVWGKLEECATPLRRTRVMDVHNMRRAGYISLLMS